MAQKYHLKESSTSWSKYAKTYDPIKCASIDGTDTTPHDKAVERALLSEYKPNRHVKGNAGCTIFISRLNHETTKDTIKNIFSKYGKLKRFRMVKDIVTGLPKGYAFVEYEEESSAEDAYKFTNKMNVDGSIIFVDFECERLLKGWRPRRLGGGFGGKKESGQLRFGGRDRPFRKPVALEVKEEEEKRRKERGRKKKQDEEEHNSRRAERSRERDRKRRSPPLKRR
ncbi:U11/U12 small nuclear ribonucleoprotein 35 kDa protein-like [Cylas formicarius]|uniref:U11/U12 small nuclear ribonucleoprotein 35 kDa protein-like n=1 Tax=Cylas formicarius TaxID=197179 RepID=UPI002958B537|nr:U11/U12 small nuclear ribonucleoprotein 35 kDa protein-like [Cylas formicarius]